jgi:hypothetical protein
MGKFRGFNVIDFVVCTAVTYSNTGSHFYTTLNQIYIAFPNKYHFGPINYTVIQI